VIAIRNARDPDERRLRELEAATWSPLVNPGPPPDPDRPFLGRFGTDNVLVAVDGEELVGSLVLGPWSPLESSRHVAEVNGIAVDPDRQGEGIGARLLDAAIARVRERGKRRLVLRVLSTNAGARRLYERHGFELQGGHREAFLLGGVYVDDLLMALDLTR
jgi:ribosomal protein S18 acetylase RimI-like enzyme